MKKHFRKVLTVVMMLAMVFAMSSTAFADTLEWTSFQGNNQNNGVITGVFSTSPEWVGVELLSSAETTGWSGISSQPLMTVEGDELIPYAYVVTDSNTGPRAFKVNCNTKKIAKGWEGGVQLTDVPTAQLGTGTINGADWYIPVAYDCQVLPNAYMSYDGGWDIYAPEMGYRYDTTNYSGLHFSPWWWTGGKAVMVSEPSTTAIDISKEDIWADFSIQFGADSSAQIYDADAKLYIKPTNEEEWTEIGKLKYSDIEIGTPKEYSINCTEMLQNAGYTGSRYYQLKIEFSLRSETKSEVIVSKAEVYKNNMYIKKIANINTDKTPEAVTMVDWHTYDETVPAGGRGGQLNTPLLCYNECLYFGTWTRADASNHCKGKYYKLNINTNTLSEYNTGYRDDNYYLAGATMFISGETNYLIFGSDNGNMYVFDAEKCKLKDVKSVEGMIRSSICYADGGLYFTSKDGTEGTVHKYIINKEGRLKKVWSTPLGEPSNATVSVYKGVVYASTGKIGSGEGMIAALDALTGKVTDSVYCEGGPIQSSLLVYEDYYGDIYHYYTTNRFDGSGKCKRFDHTSVPFNIGEAGYALQGFAAGNGCLVYGNDGVYDETGRCTVKLYITQ